MNYNDFLQLYIEIIKIDALIVNIPQDKREKVLSKLPREDQEQLSFLLKKLRNAIQELQKIR